MLFFIIWNISPYYNGWERFGKGGGKTFLGIYQYITQIFHKIGGTMTRHLVLVTAFLRFLLLSKNQPLKDPGALLHP